MDRFNRAKAEAVLLEQGWLSQQPEAFQVELFRWSVVQSLVAGTVVYRLNDPPGGIYGLVSGALAVGFAIDSGEVSLLQHSVKGGWIGVVPFLSGGPRLAEVRAATDCIVMHLPLAAMEAMAARDPAAVRSFAQIALGNLESALELLRILMRPRSEQRIAGALLRAARSGVDPVPLTQRELATITNTSPRQVSAALRTFAGQGLIEPGYRAIRIVDPAGLRAAIG